MVNSWPGVSIKSGRVRLIIYELNELVKNSIIDFNESIYDWELPKSPEDISFLTKEQEIVFYMISHERHCDLFISNDNILETISWNYIDETPTIQDRYFKFDPRSCIS